MDARRLAYLEAIGIDVWERRSESPAPVPETNGQVLVAAEASVAEIAADIETGQVPELAHADADSTLPSEARWRRLEQQIRACSDCVLHEQRQQAVPGVGDHNADWMIIGEAPGAEEDKRGEPFVGPAGQLLDLILQAIGLSRQQVYIANIVKCRPPQNRDPRPEEAEACRGYLQQQIKLVNPKLILAVGRVAAQRLLGSDAPVGHLRATAHRYEFEEQDIPLVVTYHPAYLLHNPAEKSKVWLDLQRAMTLYRRELS